MFKRMRFPAALAILLSQQSLADTSPFHYRGIIEAQVHAVDGARSWLEEGGGKFRYDEDNNREVQLTNLSLDLSYALNPSSKFNLVTHYYPDRKSGVELTEAFWQFKPISKNAWRGKYRIGAFHPAISLENRGALWTSPYTLKPSVINSWIGEELRTIGAEGKWTWQDRSRGGSKHRFSLFGALYWFNDPAGAMIAWRGWSTHDRQTGVGGTLPLRSIPALSMTRNQQSRQFEPFLEIDNRPGFYGGAEWRYRRNLKLQLFYYDNQARDTEIESGQYGWRTRFGQIAIHWRGEDGLEVLGQYLVGRTRMDRDFVDNDFESAYAMLVKGWGAHRLALRAEYFEVQDKDMTYRDSNDETGTSQTVSYSYLIGKRWKLTLEGTRHSADQRSRMYFGEPTDITEKQLTFSGRYYY